MSARRVWRLQRLRVLVGMPWVIWGYGGAGYVGGGAVEGVFGWLELVVMVR